MKELFLKAFLIFVFSITLMGVILFYEAKEKNYYSFVSHEMNVRLCAERLDTMNKSSKIIFIGGSGCGFGIDSRRISQHFNMPVINTGTHAAIGLRLQMELFRKYISNGDIIVVIPEYIQYTGLFYLGGDDTILRILRLYPEGYSNCPLWQKLYISQFIPKYYKSARVSTPIEPDDSPYSIRSLNEYGDVTAYDKRMNSYGIPIYETLTNYNPLVKRYISDYFEEVEALGAKAILLPPALSKSSFDNSAMFIERLYSRYNNEYTQLFADAPSNCCLPDSLYYDTPYHLTTQGVSIRTEMLVKQIEVVFR